MKKYIIEKYKDVSGYYARIYNNDILEESSVFGTKKKAENAINTWKKKGFKLL